MRRLTAYALVMLMAGMKAGELSHGAPIGGMAAVMIYPASDPYGRSKYNPLALPAMVIDKLRERLLGLATSLLPAFVLLSERSTGDAARQPAGSPPVHGEFQNRSAFLARIGILLGVSADDRNIDGSNENRLNSRHRQDDDGDVYLYKLRSGQFVAGSRVRAQSSASVREIIQPSSCTDRPCWKSRRTARPSALMAFC